MKISSAIILLATGANAAGEPEPDGATSTKCTTGVASIMPSDDRKAHTVQVCNLFGATCYVNHPGIAADQCATKSLRIEAGKCALYPILTSKSGEPTMSTVGDYGCSVATSNINGVFKATFGPACMSVQCSLGGDAGGETWAGPGFSSDTSGSRKVVTDTATAPFTAQSFAGVGDNAKQAKNVFLVRTGNYVGTASYSRTVSNGKGYYYGHLPTSDGNNYGPVQCPSSNNGLDSAGATAISAQDLRMCGNTGKWSYVNGYNFLEDKKLYTAYSVNSITGVGTTNKNIRATSFLDGESAYFSGGNMDDSRKIYLKADASATFLVGSDAFTPQPGNKPAFKDQQGGVWRSIGAAFYCDDYARTDLTTCKEENRKVFFTCDPNPDACYGTATQISSNRNAIGTKCTDNADCCSGKCSGDDGAKTCEAGCEVAGDYLGGAITIAPTTTPTTAPTKSTQTTEAEFSHAARSTATAMASLVCALVFAALSM